MFTGIIEAVGEVVQVVSDNTIVELTLRSPISSLLKIDQSVAHNGVCLTVVAVDDMQHTVQLVRETLHRSTFDEVKVGDLINLERSMPADGRFEGHIVQGHTDGVGELIAVENGLHTFRYPEMFAKYLVQKGSVCIHGVSLTIADLQRDTFSVALIPFTLTHTNFNLIGPGARVNLEFDILAKQLARLMALQSEGRL